MPRPADFVDAHRRHWDDAELLLGNARWANADQMYGFSAECGLKAVMQAMGMPVDAAGIPAERYRKHVRELWPEFRSFAAGPGGARYSSRLPEDNPFTDWFVEDLVGQGDRVVERIAAAPQWTQDFDGDVRVVPAHGGEAGEYLAKLGRVHMDAAGSWTARLRRLLERLESDFEPEIVLLESRSGLHDAAAAAVTDLDAQVLLFAADSESHWTGCDILFRHWGRHELAARIRERLSIVSALTPATETERYLERFRERAWDLFRDRLYDDVPSGDSGDAFSFDLHDDDAPHDPLAIHWTRGLAAGASLRDFEESIVRQAYASFLERFDKLLKAAGGEEKP